MKTTDLIALIFSATICIVLLTVILASAITGEKMTEQGAKILENMLMAIIAIISMYVGTKLKR